MATFARALYTFEGSRLDNLSFKEGDIITVLKQDEGGWWRGSSLDGRIGIFPKNYVELNEVRDSYEVVRRRTARACGAEAGANAAPPVCARGGRRWPSLTLTATRREI
jgi:hypothetical protein